VPILIVLVLIVCGFLYWVVGTTAGTRWAVETAVSQVDGLARDVSGTLWDGVSVGKLTLPLPDLDVDLEDFVLQANWRELLERRLHVNVLTASSLSVDLHPGDQPESTEPFSMPELPVQVALDHFYLGKLAIAQDGEPIPVDIGNLGAALALGGDQGQLVVRSVRVEHDAMRADVDGELEVESFASPWPLLADFNVRATGLTEDSPLCIRKHVPNLPAKKQAAQERKEGNGQQAQEKKGTKEQEKNEASGQKTGQEQKGEREAGEAVPESADSNADAEPCDLHLTLSAAGDLERMRARLDGQGQGMAVKLDAALAPSAAMPVDDLAFAVQLADSSSLEGTLAWKAGESDQVGGLSGTLRAQRFDVGSLVGPAIPEAVISMDASFSARLRTDFMPESADVDILFGEGSSWNKQALSGSLKASLAREQGNERADVAHAHAEQASANSPSSGSPSDESRARHETAAAAGGIAIEDLRLAVFDTDLHLGRNHVQTKGSLGAPDSRLTLDVIAPDLAAFWPDIPGGAQLKGALAGALAEHQAQLAAQYTPEPGEDEDSPFAKPIKAELDMRGAWGTDPAHPQAPPSWRAQFKTLAAEQGDLGVRATQAVPIVLSPQAVEPGWQWELGRTALDLLVKGKTMVAVQHGYSRGRDAVWETQGAVSRLALTPELFAAIDALMPSDDEAVEEKRGGVKIRDERPNPVNGIDLGLDWQLRFAGALQGQVRARRLSGDLMVPSSPSVPLGLRTGDIEIDLVPEGAASSRVRAALTVVTEKMGQAEITANARLHTAADGGFGLDERDPVSIGVEADIQDLGWTSLFLDDSMELGGAVRVSAQAESRSDGSWNTAGTIRGEKLRFLRLDDGVRLLDGTLDARFDNDRLVLESLNFPAVLRVTPKEWRTAEWVSSNPDAQDGRLTVSGEWYLFDSRGELNVELFRYPILQRSDRYAMMSGELAIAATLPSVSIKGQVTADAGWVDLDMVGGVPTVDGDVVVIRGGKAPQESSAPVDLALDLLVDLGPRFYLTGYGVNSGLVGQLRVVMAAGRLTGLGALRTRGGAIETYGQRLQLRRGTVTFQGDITNPVLDIEALRTGLAVEAGVKVAGTAKRPRIDLVSYPAVSELEKLSWLLLGHGPDDSGGDMALLFSVGTSFLGSGEPFYRKFGLDEVSMRSGELGSAGSILPPESVVRNLDSNTSDIENRFVMASKRFENGITLSAQQALSDTGTVGRASYRLARGLTAEITAGTVNGLALIYRWFSRD